MKEVPSDSHHTFDTSFDSRYLDDNALSLLESAVRAARQHVWAADTTCYYAHQRYVQSGSKADQAMWRIRSKESEAAVAELQKAEQALARARFPKHVDRKS